MTDEAPQIEDTPPTADTQDVDWQKRYLDLQPEYTRTTQELASIRKLIEGEDPEKLKEVLAKYGYEIDDTTDEEPEDDSDPFEDEDTEEDPRIAAHDQWIREQQEAQQQATVNQQWDGWQQFITGKAQEHGVELTPVELNGLKLNSAGRDLMPIPPAQAEKVLSEYLEQREQWLTSQIEARTKKPRVPHTPTGGSPPGGGKDPAEMSRQELNQYMLERARAEAA